jgi:hypothetical protein
MNKVQILILILAAYLSLVSIPYTGMNSVTAQNITDNETGNMTTGTVVTNGTTVNMTNASTPMITNTT